VLELALRVGFSLALVLGLFWLVARAGSRRISGGSRALVKVRGRQSLSRTSSLAVVEVGSRVLVVGVSDGGVSLLTELDPDEVEQSVAAPADTPGTTTVTTAAGLSGSLLSAGTWKQAWAAAQRRQRRTGPAEAGPGLTEHGTA
jgi:flagellar protein FliO/FliZ